MKQGSAQGKCLGGSCPCKQLFDQLCPSSPHLLHSGSLFCLFDSLCLPWHLASQNGPFAQSSWAAMGKLLLLPHHAPLSVGHLPRSAPSFSPQEKPVTATSCIHSASVHSAKEMQQLTRLTRVCVW